MLKTIRFRQTESCCGPASLKIVLAYYGIKKSEKELVKLTGCTIAKGVEAGGLVKAAKKLRLKAFYKDYCEIKTIKKYVINRKIPVIVDWFSGDDGHYSVVVDINKKNIFLQDPEIGGIKKLDLETFKRVWFDFPGNQISSKGLIVRRIIVVERFC